MNWEAPRKTLVEEDAWGNTTVTTVQDVEPVIAETKFDSNAYGSPLTFGKQRHGMRVASIPFTVYELWMKETNGALAKDPAVIKKYLNDPDNKYFRTTPTRL